MIFEIGDKVCYCGQENGIVKQVDIGSNVTRTPLVWVVFYCNDNWKDYKNYTGQAVFKRDLKKGWI